MVNVSLHRTLSKHLTIRHQVTDSFVPICAVLFVALVNKYMLSNHMPDACCTIAEPYALYDDSDDTTKTELSDTLSKASVTTAATLPIPHLVHAAHHIYYYIIELV